MRIGHVAMYVNDLERSKDFYVLYFNGTEGNKYTNKKTGFSSYFISFEDGTRLELMHRESLGEEIANGNCGLGLAHIAFCLGSEAKVNELTERFKTDGYEVVSFPRRTGDGYYESCIKDNEGNIIELTV